MRCVPHRLRRLKTWSPVDSTVWGGFGGTPLLEERITGEGKGGFENSQPCPNYSLLPLLCVKCDLSASMPIVVMPPH